MIIANSVGSKTKNLKPKTISAEIESIDSMGLMKLKFSEDINRNMSFNLVNQTYIDIFITPVYDSMKPEPRNVNLTWNLTSMTNSTLEI